MEAATTPIRQTYQTEVTEDCIPERQLWLAVITFAIEDWRFGTLRSRRDAQKFLFDDHADFERVCACAGLDPQSLRSKLAKIGRKIELEGSLKQPLAA